MPLSGVNIAICFNHEDESRNLAKKMKEFSPGANFITAPNFDGFLKAISKFEKIDCFIIEEKLNECSTVDLVEKLKKSQRYQNSLLTLFTPTLNQVNKKFLEMNMDFIFDANIDFANLHEELKNIIVKNNTPAIPTDYKVLVLDNSIDMLEIISMHIKELGHEQVEVCASIKNAKALLLEKDFDLLLLDWNLDDGTCLDLIEFIRNSSVSSRTKSSLIMVITGRDSVDDLMTLLRYHVTDTIIKPFDYKEFEDKIRYAVEKHLKNRGLK